VIGNVRLSYPLIEARFAPRRPDRGPSAQPAALSAGSGTWR